MSNTLADVAVIGFNHKSASVEKRELFSLQADRLPDLYKALKERNIEEPSMWPLQQGRDLHHLLSDREVRW
jgi:hypothetical protein